VTSDLGSGGAGGLGALARRIIDANRFMTPATADGKGRPWPSPAWYAHVEYRDFLWVSRPDARHSTNLAARPDAGIVIFDSTVSPAEVTAVYVECSVEQLAGPELERGIESFSHHSVTTGTRAWAAGDVLGSAAHRLYRARASAHYVLVRDDRRQAVRL